MGKDKKKHSKKDKASDDLLDVATLSIKKFRKVTKEIGKLSTGQKLVGGIALVAAGLTYLATQDTPAAAASESDQPEPPRRLPASPSGEDEPAEAPAHRKSRKSAKAKSASHSDS